MQLRTLATTTNSIVIDYTLIFDAVLLGYANQPLVAFTLLVNKLKDSINSGNFTSRLQAYALLHGISDFSSVSSSSVVIDSTYTDVSTSGDDDNANDTNSDSNNQNNITLIIGVAVGVAGGLLILSVLLYFLCLKHGVANSKVGDKTMNNNAKVVVTGGDADNSPKYSYVPSGDIAL